MNSCNYCQSIKNNEFEGYDIIHCACGAKYNVYKIGYFKYEHPFPYRVLFIKKPVEEESNILLIIFIVIIVLIILRYIFY